MDGARTDTAITGGEAFLRELEERQALLNVITLNSGGRAAGDSKK